MWLAIAIAAVLIAAVMIPYVIGMGQRLDLRMYETYLAKYSSECLEGDGITADVDGETVAVDSGRLDAIIRCLTVGGEQRIRATEAPESFAAHMTLRFGPEAAVELYALDEAKEDTIILAQLGQSFYGWKLEKLRVYGQVEDYVLQRAAAPRLNLGMGADVLRYDTAVKQAAADCKDHVTAELAGETRALSGDTLDAVLAQLTYAKPQWVRLIAAPTEWTEQLTIRFGEQMTVTLFSLDEAGHDTALETKIGGIIYVWHMDALSIYATTRALCAAQEP